MNYMLLNLKEMVQHLICILPGHNIQRVTLKKLFESEDNIAIAFKFQENLFQYIKRC